MAAEFVISVSAPKIIRTLKVLKYCVCFSGGEKREVLIFNMLIYTEFLFVEIALRLGGARLSGSSWDSAMLQCFSSCFFERSLRVRLFAVLIWNFSAACFAYRTRPGAPRVRAHICNIYSIVISFVENIYFPHEHCDTLEMLSS